MDKTITISDWDVAEYLKTEKDIAEYLDAALEYNDLALLKLAISDVMRARGVSDMAQHVKVSREGLYASLSENGNPSIETIAGVLNTFGCRLAVVPMA
ncbi:MAG: putative addiction module antidote protein [Prevotellaceae bacterium]|jgi:probable addiction module antidote protein|nr:putative addiction module antidote protein [Prevotellaceae bacterium]